MIIYLVSIKIDDSDKAVGLSENDFKFALKEYFYNTDNTLFYDFFEKVDITILSERRD